MNGRIVNVSLHRAGARAPGWRSSPKRPLKWVDGPWIYDAILAHCTHQHKSESKYYCYAPQQTRPYWTIRKVTTWPRAAEVRLSYSLWSAPLTMVVACAEGIEMVRCVTQIEQTSDDFPPQPPHILCIKQLCAILRKPFSAPNNHRARFRTLLSYEARSHCQPSQVNSQIQ